MAEIHDNGRNGITPWDTRFRPLPVPTEGIFDAPTMSICVNVKWGAHLDGLLSRLLWLDAWQGDRNTQLRGVSEIVKLMAALVQRNPCGGDMIDVRQNPELCHILEKKVDGVWVPFADLDECIVGEDGQPGADGASPEMRVSGGWIQWKLSNSDTWNNLILVADLIGPQGIQGIPGLDGFDGADAAPGAPGAGGNEYPPRPTSSQAAPLCNAATYVVNQIRNLIVDIYAKLADTLTPAEIVDSLLARSGWSVGALYDLVAFGAGSLANEMANLAAFDAAKADLICELISYELDKAAFVDWIDTTYAGQATLRDMLKAAINSVSDQGIYATWIAVGATMEGAECDCEPPSTALCTSGVMQDFRTSQGTWLPYQSRAQYEATLGFKRASNTAFFTIEKLGNIAVTRVKIRTSSNLMGTAAVIRRNTQTSIVGGSTTVATLQPDGSYIWDVNVTSWGTTFGLIVRFNRTEGIPATAYIQEVCYE